MYIAGMSSTLNGSLVIQCFKHDDAFKFRDGIILDFYMGLPHVDGFHGPWLNFQRARVGVCV